MKQEELNIAYCSTLVQSCFFCIKRGINNHLTQSVQQFCTVWNGLFQQKAANKFCVIQDRGILSNSIFGKSCALISVFKHSKQFQEFC